MPALHHVSAKADLQQEHSAASMSDGQYLSVVANLRHAWAGRLIMRQGITLSCESDANGAAKAGN